MNSKALCRCCLTHPSDKDLSTIYFRFDEDERNEVYGDMLKECFGIKMSLESNNSDNGICNICITRLRDATDFKYQVLHCQEEFQLKLLNRISNDNYEFPFSEETLTTKGNGTYLLLEPKKELEEFDLISDRQTEIVGINEALRKTSHTKKSAKKPIPHSKNNGTEFASTFTLTFDKNGKPEYTCKICQNVYGARGYIYQHYKHVHLKQRPKLRSCHLCNVKVPPYMRSFHMEEHGIPAPSCGACGKKFAYPFQVVQHQKFYHMGEAKYHCEPCNLKFKSQSKYNHHLNKHKDEKAFKCELCEKTFKWKSGLITHMLIHNNVRRHVCHICQCAFVQLTSLKYHLTKKHPEAVQHLS